jgi:D-alanyl-D-alanine carboxypeptidase/D-alanyl-D-alanine-endopeptidase (penicillin-binding protein 4)
VVALVGGYLVLDAHDVVPGILTLDPPPIQPAPFPTPPGAVAAPAPSEPFSGLPDDAPIPSADAVGALVSALTGDERLGNHTGVYVRDALTDETLGTALPDTGFTPASTQKMLTGVAAMTQLDPSSRLETKAVMIADGHLVLVGAGDMMLAAGAGNDDAVFGRAGIKTLAEQTAAAVLATGTDSVQLSLDDTLFTGPVVSAAVPDDEFSMGFIAPVSPLAIALAVPAAPKDYEAVAVRQPDPAMSAATVFKGALVDAGLAVAGELRRVSEPAQGTVVGSVESATILEIVEFAMQHSENTVTEVLGRLVAVSKGLPGSLDSAIQAVKSTVESVGVDLDGSVLVDLSGLGRGSLLSPRQLASVVAATMSPEHPRLRELALGMPIANLTGTLNDRFPAGNPARGWARAKTGSLPSVAGLAGTVVTAENRLLVFAVVGDGMPQGGAWGARAAIDGFVGKLVGVDG